MVLTHLCGVYKLYIICMRTTDPNCSVFGRSLTLIFPAFIKVHKFTKMFRLSRKILAPLHFIRAWQQASGFAPIQSGKHGTFSVARTRVDAAHMRHCPDFTRCFLRNEVRSTLRCCCLRTGFRHLNWGTLHSRPNSFKTRLLEGLGFNSGSVRLCFSNFSLGSVCPNQKKNGFGRSVAHQC